MSQEAIRRFAILFGVLLGVTLLPGVAQAEDPAQAAQELLVSTHVRLSFDKDVNRLAVADEDILGGEVLTPREVLLLGKSPGRTTVMVWFEDGGTDFFLFHVRRDLSLLEEALKEIYSTIRVQAAPDRDAVVLRGLVPDISYANAAEEAAQRYLDARRAGRRPAPAVAGIPDDLGSPPAGAVEVYEAARSSGIVINLIRVETLPGRMEDRMQAAIAEILDDQSVRVRVHRLVRGRLPNDEEDIFVLEGRVPTQVELIRVLSLAQSMLGVTSENSIKVRADESGALTSAQNVGGMSNLRGSQNLQEVFGGSMAIGRQLQNEIDSNLGRAKVIEAAKGRILSFLEVTDLPQVRVDIRLYEVNSSLLRDYSSDWALLLSNFTQPSLNPGSIASAAQGRGAARVGDQGENPDVQNALGFLAGTLANQFQLAGDNVAFASVLSLLESKGWARSLARPSLTVLSGERAFFQVGGEVPIPQSFATTTVAVTEGVFNSVVFKPFGVQVGIRPLVGERGDITLDVIPEISLPDAQLTAALRDTTGTDQVAASFRTRYLKTTARLKDGDALMLGGILSRNMSSTDEGTPGLSDLPFVGGMFSNYARNGDEIQLIIVVHPVIEREPTNKARMWAFPGVNELMRGVRAPAGIGRGCR